MLSTLKEHQAYGIARELPADYERVTLNERRYFFEEKGITIGNLYQRLAGYVPTENYVPEGSNPNALGIKRKVWKDSSFFCGLFKHRESEDFYVGTLWFDKELGAQRERKWVFETYGMEHLNEIKRVIEKHAKVNGDVNLEILVAGISPLPRVDLSAFRGSG